MNILIETKPREVGAWNYIVRVWKGDKEKLLDQEPATVGTVVRVRNKLNSAWSHKEEVDEVTALPIPWPATLRTNGEPDGRKELMLDKNYIVIHN